MTPAYQSDRVTIYCADVCEAVTEVRPVAPAIVLTDPPWLWFPDVEKILATKQFDIEHDVMWSGGLLYWALQWFPDVMHCAEGGAALIFSSPHYAAPFLRIGDVCDVPWRGAWPAGEMSQLLLAFGAVETGPIPEVLRSNNYGQDKDLDTLGGLLALSPPGLPVVDPFMGGGNTLIAALASGRQAMGVEIQEATCERAIRRVRHYEQTGEVVA